MPPQTHERIALEWNVAVHLREALIRRQDRVLSEQVLALLEDHSNDDVHAPEVVASATLEPELVAYIRERGVPHREL